MTLNSWPQADLEMDDTGRVNWELKLLDHLLLLPSCFRCVRLFVTPWTAVYQAPPCMGFSRREYWSGVPLPSLLTHSSRSHFFSFLTPVSTSLTQHPLPILLPLSFLKLWLWLAGLCSLCYLLGFSCTSDSWNPGFVTSACILTWSRRQQNWPMEEHK